MTARPAPRPIGPCDICGAPEAAFGYAPPGFRSLRPGQRALRACGAAACRQAAEDRRAAALAPFAPRPTASAAPAAPPADPPAPPADPPAQGRLI